MSTEINERPQPDGSTKYDRVSAWLFVRRVEASIATLQHLQTAAEQVPAAVSGGTWEERDAVSSRLRCAAEAAQRDMDASYDNLNIEDALAREIGTAEGAEEWAVHQRLTELWELLSRALNKHDVLHSIPAE